MLSQKITFSFLQPCSIPLCKCTTAFVIHSCTVGCLGCYQILANVNNTAMIIGVHIFFRIGIVEFLGCIPRSGITGTNGSSILNFFEEAH